jgi:hypothetical protein
MSESDPRVNMLDDHDLIDGFGTYDDETQSAPVMSFIGGRGYFVGPLLPGNQSEAYI